MTAGFPDFVFNSPQDRETLRRVFSYEAEVYDLQAYEKISTGLGQKIWDMIEAEREHQVWLKKHAERLEAAKRAEYILP